MFPLYVRFARGHQSNIRSHWARHGWSHFQSYLYNYSELELVFQSIHSKMKKAFTRRNAVVDIRTVSKTDLSPGATVVIRLPGSWIWILCQEIRLPECLLLASTYVGILVTAQSREDGRPNSHICLMKHHVSRRVARLWSIKVTPFPLRRKVRGGFRRYYELTFFSKCFMSWKQFS